MKLPLVVQQIQSLKGSGPGGFSPFWLLIHFLCCLGSTVLGFRFSRLLFFLFFSSSPLFSGSHLSSSSTITTTTTTTTITTITTTFSSSFTSNSSSLPPPPLNVTTATPTPTSSFSQPVTTRPVVGRHGIRVRPWPHPDPLELMRAHHIIRQVQLEQRKMFSTNNPRPILVVTPTYLRAAQALHLTALAHTLRLVPYHLTWLVIEAGALTNVTASILARSRLSFFHLAFADSMPHSFEARRAIEDKMRLHALRLISQQKMQGVIVFADESNIHDLKLFDEAQKVKSVGAINLSFLTDPRNPNQENNAPVVQGPVCNSDGQLSGWRTLDSTNDGFAPEKMEWAGFFMDSKWLLEKDLNKIDANLKGLLGDNGSGIEPLGKCADNVLVWWIRAETQADTKFPPGWAIEKGIPSKRETNSTAKRR
ncbi:hypothetical protein LUZ61_008365 [Rhynchospora tenuis]|uniref:Glycosyltransferases n=1 Tax=Rhynchospora tenuis TaxID=198213 RepID=A0AAD5ZV60_9POAL|nr:hypothetical protein LUZ61_008365 [Rhynchospora tenuis]